MLLIFAVVSTTLAVYFLENGDNRFLPYTYGISAGFFLANLNETGKEILKAALTIGFFVFVSLVLVICIYNIMRKIKQRYKNSNRSYYK